MNSRLQMLRLLIVWIFSLAVLPAYPYNMRQSSNSDGLSNSAILSLCRDDNGFLWIGTCDGVNIADGLSINPFTSIFPGQTLSGNIIETIFNGGNGKMWILTNHGLDLVDSNTHTVSAYPQFNGQELLCVDEKGTLFVLVENSGLMYQDPDSETGFSEAGKIDIPFADVKKIAIRDGALWIISNNGIHSAKITTTAKGGKSISEKITPLNRTPIMFAKIQDEEIYIIDGSGNICEIKEDGKSHVITNISDELAKRGRISNLVKDHQGNFFISFSTDGVLWVGLNEAKQFQPVDLGLQVGVFCLEQSPDQDVVWIGSDCQGLYTYWDDLYSFRSFDFNAFNSKISHPVRAIHIDKYKNLWLGTKGDGLLKVADFNEFYPPSSIGSGNLYTSTNSALSHNSVFAFGESSRPLLWIATEEGLNYYNYNEGKLYKASLDPEIKFVHGVKEINDSTLWVCTLGEGVAKITISGDMQHPHLSKVEKYTLDNGAFSSNQFFSIVTDKKGNIFFCNRGRGMFEIKNGQLSSIPLKNDFGTNGVNDIFDAFKDRDNFWLGTGSGLVKSSPGETTRFFGSQYGFTNNTIHEIVPDNDNKIWVTTNNGIVRFNPENNEAQIYGKNFGINVTEFSDGASFNTGNTLLFGGINGIVSVNRHGSYVAPEPFSPNLSLLKLKVSGEEVPLNDHLDVSGNRNRLVFESNQNHFALTLVAPDFINADNYTYYYTLDGKDWINNGASSTISFNEMNHGSYNLQVKYINRATGVESDPYHVQITINAPWYLSGTAKFIYLLLILAMAGGLIYVYLHRQKEKQEKQMLHLEQAHKEEVYEEKLRFFTNITHEFCTPLTLIYGPCERILDYPGSDDYIRKYVGLIRSNAERLNNLIQELIDFRRIETGHKSVKVRRVGVSELCNDTYQSFTELAERNNIDFVNEIKPDIIWNSDFSCLKKILNNLISNAFKYTSPGGTIKVGAEELDGRLRITVYNTGKGVREEDKHRIFNRYTVLDNVEQNAIKGISSRNGLGMAICHSMVDMLHGTISIESEVGKFAEFIVVLPQLTLTETTEPETLSETHETEPDSVSSEDKTTKTTDKKSTDKKSTKNATILVLDDNKEILTLLRDSLTQYNVVTAENVDEGLSILKETPPDLIISDIMMPGTDGTEFTRQIKGNRHTMHIPLILLSAKTSNEEKVKGIEAGADAYIGKPFSITYLKAVVKRLLENREHLKEYYNTSASTFEFSGGKLMHREEKDFLTKVTDFIDSHIDDNDLSAEQIALHLKTSSRNLYRKFKEIGEVSPNDFIKNHRINYAARLLLTTSLTVQEIIYRCGFTNRSHFYKEFSKRFDTTPKEYRTANQAKDTDL